MSIDKTELKYEMSKEDREKFLNMPEEDKISVFEKILSNLDYQKEVEKTLAGIQEELNKLKKDILSDSKLNKLCEEEECYTAKEMANIAGGSYGLLNNIDFSDYVLKNNLKKILEKRGINQTWVQERTGIKKSTFYSIVNSINKKVSLEDAYRIAEVLGIGITDIFPYEKENNNLEK